MYFVKNLDCQENSSEKRDDFIHSKFKLVPRAGGT